MKKTGIRKPKPTASSLREELARLGAADHDPDHDPGREGAEDHVEPELGRERRRGRSTRSTDRRTASWPLVPIVVCTRRTTRPARARSASRVAATTIAAKANSSVARSGSSGVEGEDHRDEHDRPELAGGAGADDEVRRSAGRACRRRAGSASGSRARSSSAPGRRARVAWMTPALVQAERDDSAEHEREQPAEDAGARRRAADALEVDLDPGEEEQEGEPEGRERLDEVVERRRARAPAGRR